MRLESRSREGLYDHRVETDCDHALRRLQVPSGGLEGANVTSPIPREFYLADEVESIPTARIFPLRAVEALYPTKQSLVLRKKCVKHPLRAV